MNFLRNVAVLGLLVLASGTALAALPVTKGMYVGAVSINASQDAKVLAEWYARLGIATKEIAGGFYGKLDTAAGPVAFAIHSKKADAPPKSSGSVAVVFHVENFDAQLMALQAKGLTPEKIEKDAFGQFAHFHDPDGNDVTLWGTAVAETLDQAAVRAARVAQNAAIVAHNLERVASFWTDDVIIQRGLGAQAVGKDAYLQLFKGGDPKSALLYQRVSDAIEVSPDWPLAFESGHWEGSVNGKVRISGKYSAQWVKRDGRWLIRGEVYVALAGHDEGKQLKATP